MGKPTPRDEMPLQPQMTFEPFEKWGMDFVGPINPPSNQNFYIIECTDYLTKWEETKAIKVATEEKVAEFLRENIFYKIKNKTSTPYHLQANGQVEATNRALEEILTKVLDLDLSNAQQERLVQLHGLDEQRMQALLHSEVVQLQRKIWHDRYLKGKQFHPGDWALLYDSRYKDFKGNLRTRWLAPYTVERCNDNGLVLVRTIDEEAIPMLVNGHQLKIYKKPLSKQEFIETLDKSVLVVE
eukprot:PITA_35501